MCSNDKTLTRSLSCLLSVKFTGHAVLMKVRYWFLSFSRVTKGGQYKHAFLSIRLSFSLILNPQTRQVLAQLIFEKIISTLEMSSRQDKVNDKT